jgi:hypothetical protein
METQIRQTQCAAIVRDLATKAQEPSRPAEQRDKIVTIASKYAWVLYCDLELSTGKPPVSEAMERRIGVPSDPGYFESIDAIKEFLSVIDGLGKPTTPT